MAGDVSEMIARMLLDGTSRINLGYVMEWLEDFVENSTREDLGARLLNYFKND